MRKLASLLLTVKQFRMHFNFFIRLAVHCRKCEVPKVCGKYRPVARILIFLQVQESKQTIKLNKRRHYERSPVMYGRSAFLPLKLLRGRNDQRTQTEHGSFGDKPIGAPLLFSTKLSAYSWGLASILLHTMLWRSRNRFA